MPVRVRFAPSPTGPLHIGGLRTALFNCIFARKHNGTFILRIEDTDRNRYVKGAEAYILESLQWCDLVPDEGPGYGGAHGPYRQSERREIYGKHVQMLIDSGWAYYAFDTPEELEQMRRIRSEEGVQAPKYDHNVRKRMRNSLTLPESEVRGLLSSGEAYTVRLKIPADKKVAFTDVIRGSVAFHSDELDDKVLLKADGLPTYHLANVVDDHLMEISHVIRGEEWLSSTALHVLLYEALGWEDSMPVFAHLPLILRPEGQGKLSKRDGARFGFPVFPLAWKTPEETYTGFRESGFMPDALLNFLAFLGWNPGTEQEMFDRDALVRNFSLDQITKSGSRFDYDKALWYNSQYIQNADIHRLTGLVAPYLRAAGRVVDPDFLVEYCTLLQPRARLLTDFVTEGVYFFERPQAFDEKMIGKKWSPALRKHFLELAEMLRTMQTFSRDSIEQTVKGYISAHALKFGDVLPMMRVCVSGSPAGPDVFATLALLGQVEVVERIQSAVDEFDEIVKSEH